MSWVPIPPPFHLLPFIVKTPPIIIPPLGIVAMILPPSSIDTHDPPYEQVLIGVGNMLCHLFIPVLIIVPILSSLFIPLSPVFSSPQPPILLT
jgi:hypothetical protein